MRVFRIIAHAMIFLTIVMMGIAILFFRTKLPREQAEFFYKLQKQFPDGSEEEQWILNKAIELDSSYALAYREKATSFIRNGLFEEGMHFINQAVSQDPINQLGYRGHVKLFTIGDYQGALNDFIALDSLTPNFRDAPWGNDIYYVMGLAHYGLRDFTKAYDYLNRSIEETAKERSEEWVNVEIFLYRGLMSWELNRLEEALQDFDKAIYYYDKFSEAHYYKAKALKEAGRLDQAIESATLARKYLNMGYQELHPYYKLPFQISGENIDMLIEDLVMVSGQ